jgi:hypothetical protein
VALLIPGQTELSADEAAELRRHLALCATCAEEAAWIKGERTAESSRPGRAAAAGARRVWPWAVAAAAAVLLAAFVPAWLRPAPVEIETGVVGVQFVYATQRAGGVRSEVRVPADASWFHFNIEVDALSSDFPLSLEIIDADERVAYRLDGIGEADLQGGSWLVICRRDEFPDGDYLARVLGSNPDIELIGEYPLRVTTRP